MNITNRNSNTSTTGLYRKKYNNNNLSTGSEIRSLSATLQPRSVGTSWNSIRWNKTQPTDAYKGHSSRLSKAFESKVSTTTLPFNSYSLSPAIKRNLGTKTSSSLISSTKTNNYSDTNGLKSTYNFDTKGTIEKIGNTTNSYNGCKSNLRYNYQYSHLNNYNHMPLSLNKYSASYIQTKNNTSNRNNMYSGTGNSMAITSAMSNLGTQYSTPKNDRPWRQRLADSARLRNLEGTGEIASKVSGKYMIQRAAKRDSITSGDEMSNSTKQYHSIFDKTSKSPSYLFPNDDNDSGVMSKSITSRSSWNNSIISSKSSISQLDKSSSQMHNSTDNSINKISNINLAISKNKHMDNINESDIKMINNKKSIKERTERRNSRKNLASQLFKENKNKEKDYSSSTTSSSSEENKDKMKENCNVLRKKKKKLRKKDSLINNEIKKENYETLINPEISEKPVIIKKIIKQPSITEFPPSIQTTFIPLSTTLKITNEKNNEHINNISNNMKENKKIIEVEKEIKYCPPNTEYIKRTPIKKFIKTIAEKPKVVDENKKINNVNNKEKVTNEGGKESSDESKYNDVVHFKLPSRIPNIVVEKQSLKENGKKIPPIPGIFITDNNEINISINKHFKTPEPKFLVYEEASKIIYTKSLKNVHEKVIGTFKELKRKKRKILVIRASFDLKKDSKNECELLNYTYYDKTLKNKDSIKKFIKVPIKTVVNISIEKLLIKNISGKNNNKTSIIKKVESIYRENFFCKCISLKQKLLDIDVIKKSEEKKANVIVMTSNITDINFNSISKDIQLYSPIHSIDSLTPKAMTEEPLSVDISLTLPAKCFQDIKRASAPPESSHRRRIKNIETRASIVLKRLRLEDPVIYDTQPTIIPEYNQKYIHLKADPNYIPGDPIILPDSSILEEYVRRKRGNLEKYIHEPIIEENSSLSSYSNNTFSHCDSSSIASTISEYHPPLPVKIIEPNFAHTSKIKSFKNISKLHINSENNNNNNYNMIDMVDFNLNKPKFVTNNKQNDIEKDNFLNLIRKPLRSREHVPSTNINKVFDKPHSAFEERMQNQAKAVVLRRTNPSIKNSFLESNSKTNESMNASFDITWSSPDTLNDKRHLSADSSNHSKSTHQNYNNLITLSNTAGKQKLAQTFTHAAAAASQPRHERYAAHLPASNNSQINKESNGRQSTTSVDSNNSLVLEKASTQVEQMIDNAKFKHQQSRNKFKDAIEYLDQIFEDFKKDTITDENKKKNSISKGKNLFPTTGYIEKSNPNEFNSLKNNSRRTIDSIKNITLYHQSNGQVSSNNSSRKPSYSQNNSLIEDNVVEVSETIKLPPTNKKLSSDKLDFTQKWLVNDVKSWANSQKSETFMNNEPVNFDCDEGSIGSCSAEVAAINSKERERKRVSNVKNDTDNVKKQIPNSYLIKPHPYRPQPFPIEGMIKKIPSIEQIQGNTYQPTGSQFFKPPSMVSLNELFLNRCNNRAQSQEYQGNNNENNNGMFMKLNDNNEDKNKTYKNFGSIQSLPDAGMLRNHNGGSLKIVRKKDDAMKAIDALVAELEMNVNDENTKRKSFPLNGGNNNNNQYAQINKEYEKNTNIGLPKPASTSNSLTKKHKKNDSHQLDEMANLLTTVASDIGNIHSRRGNFNNIQVYESSIKGTHNPFEKINNERIGGSRVEAMHSIFENKKLQPNHHYNSGVTNYSNQINYPKNPNNLWNRNCINQKNLKQFSQNTIEDDNYYEVADFDINNLKQKASSKISLNSITYPEYIPSYPSSQPPSLPPQSSSINSLNHGFYSSTNSSSATIPTINTNSLHKTIKNQPLSTESLNQVTLSRQESIVERQSLLSKKQNTINNEEDDDGFYDNILSNGDDDRRFSRDNETLDNISISSTKYSTTPRNNGNKLSNLLRKFSIGSTTNIKPSSTDINNKRNNLTKSNSLSMEPWEKQVLQGQSSGRKSPGNTSQTNKKNSLGNRIKNSIFGSKKSLKNIY
uniref:Protein kinase domain-containing protein n=1 Tax=Strongyloides stercoralis TaxID=6248 RepID=A0A913HH46_STRER